MKVMKFGGSCLQSRAGVLRMIERVRPEERPLVIVLSALKGVTDELIALLERARGGVAPPLDALRRRHDDVLAELAPSARTEAARALDARFAELARLLDGVAALGEVPSSTRDRIVSFGERFSVLLAAAHLEAAGVPARVLVAEEAGILTTAEAGDARILAQSREAVRAALRPDEEVVYVVAGFVGRDPDGRLTTLGRGGSDTTATYLASVLGGPAVLWKDTPGLLTGDPRVVARPQVIERLHYLDALELAHYGLPAIALKALHPARHAGISIEIRSFLEDTAPSVIGEVPTSHLAISCVPDVVMIDLVPEEATVVTHHAGLPLAPAPSPGRVLALLAQILEELARTGVVPLLLTEASPAGEVTLAIKAADREAVEGVLAARANGHSATVRDALAAVSLIGSSMRGKIGFAATVFECLAGEGINVESIAQTASERTISVIVAACDARAAVLALHRRFVEERALGE
ncbi:MAG: aspartate kinase [Planctomycetota bacterium]|nr:MAG: aspartate kinase [Planctomycetota bacterium]